MGWGVPLPGALEARGAVVFGGECTITCICAWWECLEAFVVLRADAGPWTPYPFSFANWLLCSGRSFWLVSLCGRSRFSPFRTEREKVGHPSFICYLDLRLVRVGTCDSQVLEVGFDISEGRLEANGQALAGIILSSARE
jgi:hypothetical protein